MKKIWAGFKVVLLVLFVFISEMSFAGDPAGLWYSSSGSVVNIWCNLQQVVVNITANGKTYKYSGWWQTLGESFNYTVPGVGSHIAYYPSPNASSITVKDPNGKVYYWTRNRQNTASVSNFSIDGNWISSSGNIFQVTAKGNQIFVNAILTDGRRLNGMGRWIISGKKFDYSFPGDAVAAICNISEQNSNLIFVDVRGTRTTWQRQ